MQNAFDHTEELFQDKDKFNPELSTNPKNKVLYEAVNKKFNKEGVEQRARIKQL